MIPVGSKLIVLASSTSKSGAKIRKGSIGYLLSTDKSHYLQKLNMFATPARIIFTRFGYEKLRRSEPKFVVLIHPSINTTNISNIQKFLNKLVCRSLDSTDQLRKIFKNHGAEVTKINSIVVCKTSIETNISANYNEFKSWILSIMHGGYLHPLFMLDKNDPLNKVKERIVDGLPEFSNKFRKCVKYRGTSNLIAEKLFNNIADRQRIIKQLKQYSHLCIRREVVSINNNIQSFFLKQSSLFNKLHYLMNVDSKLLDEINPTYSNKHMNKLIGDWSQAFKHLNK